MGVIRKVSDYRERQIVSHVAQYRDGDEEVIQWVRARRVEGRGDGFAYLTEKAFVIHMSGRSDGIAVEWPELEAWGVITDSEGGPILVVETSGETHLVRLQVSTRRMAEDAGTFVERFSQIAPEPGRELKEESHLGTVETSGRVNIKHEKKTLSTHTRRVAFTLVGISLIVIAVLIGFIPGPWSIPLVIAGLAVLAQEYDWAKDILDWFREKRTSAARWIKARGRSTG